MADTGSGRKGRGALGELVKAESIVQLAFALPAGCVVGWLAGAWADRHFHQSWIAIVGILLGALAGFVQIYRIAMKYLKNDRS